MRSRSPLPSSAVPAEEGSDARRRRQAITSYSNVSTYFSIADAEVRDSCFVTSRSPAASAPSGGTSSETEEEIAEATSLQVHL